MGSAKFPNFSNFTNSLNSLISLLAQTATKKHLDSEVTFLYSRKAISNPQQLQLQLFEGQADGLFDAEVGVLFEEFFEYFF